MQNHIPFFASSLVLKVLPRDFARGVKRRFAESSGRSAVNRLMINRQTQRKKIRIDRITRFSLGKSVIPPAKNGHLGAFNTGEVDSSIPKLVRVKEPPLRSSAISFPHGGQWPLS